MEMSIDVYGTVVGDGQVKSVRQVRDILRGAVRGGDKGRERDEKSGSYQLDTLIRVSRLCAVCVCAEVNLMS